MNSKTFFMIFVVQLLFLATNSSTAISDDGMPPRIPTLAYISDTNSQSIIVAGSGPSSENWQNGIWQETRYQAKLAYKALLSRGYTGNRSIFYFSESEDTLIIDDIETNIVDETEVTLDTLEQQIRNQICYSTFSPESFLIYLVGHGGPEGFRLNSNEILMPETLAEWLSKLKCPDRIIVIVESCFSGKFITEIQQNITLSDAEMIFISSASSEDAVMARDGKFSFSSSFWQGIFQGHSISQSFVTASSLIDWYQTPLIDINRNGIMNETDEIEEGNFYFIGSGDETSIPIVQIDSAYIDHDGENNFLITAELESLENNPNAFALIRSPCFRRFASGFPITDPEQIVMNLNDVDQYFFNYLMLTNGKYQFKLYASSNFDGWEFISSPKQIELYQSDGMYYCKGDLDQDGSIGLLDSLIALQILTGKKQNLNQIEGGSIAGIEGKIGLSDAIFALQITAGSR